MTNKIKTQPKQKRDAMPEHFDSLEEAAKFWDTHDSVDYDDYFVDASFEVDLKKRTLQIDRALYDQLCSIAKKKRIPTSELLNRWIKEKLRSAA